MGIRPTRKHRQPVRKYAIFERTHSRDFRRVGFVKATSQLNAERKYRRYTDVATFDSLSTFVAARYWR